MIYKNSAVKQGGGAWFWGFSLSNDFILTNNTFSENAAAERGGAIYGKGNGYVTQTNDILWNNNSPLGPEIALGWGSTDNLTFITSYSDVKGGQSQVYINPFSPSVSVNWGTGMIDVDPLFADTVYDNFRLAANSPCIDRGDINALELSDIDFEGDDRVVDGDGDSLAVVDIGADEYVAPPIFHSDKGMYRYDLGRTGNYSNGPLTFPAQEDLQLHVGGGKPSVVVAHDRIYVGTGGHIYVINNETYEIEWDFNVEQALGDSVESYVAVARHYREPDAGEQDEDYLYFGTQGLVSAGVYRGKIGCLDLNNKTVKWTHETNGFVQISPVVSEGIVYSGSSDGYVYALDAQTGELKWRHGVGGAVWGGRNAPVVANDIVYIASYSGVSKLHALHAQTGAEIWSKAGSGPSYIYFNNAIYLMIGQGGIQALDPFTGELQDEYSCPEGYSISTNLVQQSEKIYFAENHADNGQRLIALDKNNLAEPVLVRALPMQVGGDLAVSQDILYLSESAFDGCLYGLDAQEGEMLDSLCTPSTNEHFEMPFIDNQKLYLVSVTSPAFSGYLYVYKEYTNPTTTVEIIRPSPHHYSLTNVHFEAIVSDATHSAETLAANLNATLTFGVSGETQYEKPLTITVHDPTAEYPNGYVKLIYASPYLAGDYWYTYTLSVQTSFVNGLDYTDSVTFHRCPPPPPSPGGGCFLAGTPVTMADGTTLPIEQLKVGDMVLAFDEDTGTFQSDAVKRVFVFPENDEGYLIINNRIKVTPHHRFYMQELRSQKSEVRGQTNDVPGRWVEAGKLKEGDILLTKEGKHEPITSLEYKQATETVYNLEVNPYHTFVAGDVVVHNMSLVVDSTGRYEVPMK